MKKVLGVVFIALTLLSVLTSCAKDKSSEQFSKVIDNMSVDSQDRYPSPTDDKLITVGEATVVSPGEDSLDVMLINEDVTILMCVFYDNIIFSSYIAISDISIAYVNCGTSYEVELINSQSYRTKYTKEELVTLLSKLSADDILSMLKSKNIIFTLS